MVIRIDPYKNSTTPKKIRVAAYARVSTNSDEQLQSLKAQKEHYESYIKEHFGWDYAGLYYDEGLSGTKMEQREGLLNMLKDCENGKIDKVITKSISRLSRNTANTLSMVRMLQKLGVHIYFEKENIDTECMDSELVLTILSSIAESESRSISDNTIWAIKHRYEDGTYIIAYPPYGYKNENGKMVVIPSEAEVVKKIFSMALSGQGSDLIARELNETYTPTRRGGAWHSSTVQDILRNEKYTGDVIFQKTYTDTGFKRHHNYGEKNRYLYRNHHEAIIDREIFDKVAQCVQRRGAEKGNDDGFKYNKRYAFTRKIICGECGATFKRQHHYIKTGAFIAWACNTHLKEKEACTMLYVKEEDLQAAFVRMMNKLCCGHTKVLRPFVQGLRGFHDRERLRQIKEIEDKLGENNTQQQVLVELMATGHTDIAELQQEKNKLLQEAEALIRKKESLAIDINGNIKHLTEAEKLLKFTSRKVPILAYNDDMFLTYVDSITVKDRYTFVFNLKCGLNLTEKAVKR